MQIDDILKAAMQDAGLETSLEHNSNSNDDYFNFYSNTSCTSSSTSEYPYSNGSNSNGSISLNSPTTSQNNTNDPFSLINQHSSSSTFDCDPFLSALKQLEDHNSQLGFVETSSASASSSSNHHHHNNEQNDSKTTVYSQSQMVKPILKVNHAVLLNQNKPSSVAAQPVVKYISIDCLKKTPSQIKSDISDLLTSSSSSSSSSSTGSPAPAVKIINLSHQQNRNLQEHLHSTNTVHQIIKVNNNNNPIKSNNTNKPVYTVNNVKITEVVPSRPLLKYSPHNNTTTTTTTNVNKNVVYFNKTNNQYFPVSKSSTQVAKIYSTSTVSAHQTNNLSIKTQTNTVTINPKFMINLSTNGGGTNSSGSGGGCGGGNQTIRQHQLNAAETTAAKHHNNQQQQAFAYLGDYSSSGLESSASLVDNSFVPLLEQDEEVVVEEEEELGHAETYANYMPSKLQIGISHPDPIVETSSLASVEPPDVHYELKIPERIYSKGALSALQLEAIVYASQKHGEFLPNQHRCGFLIGDGAGVGKGRTIAGVIYENYLHGRKKALWLSVSNDLKFDAQRDFLDIGARKIQVHNLNKLKYNKISSKKNANIKKGVIFSTYSSLIGESQHKTTKKKYNTRLKQLIQWLGGESFDGVIVFDECHKAKNLVPCGSTRPTKTGLAVLELQEKLPNARIVYASATGASEPKNMAYMVRLGLWGPQTPFQDFNDFIQSIEKRGVGAMEIVAMDMKLRGMYMARQLSFSGVSFKIEEIALKEEYIRMYDDSVRLWVEMKDRFQEALDLVDLDGKLKKTVWTQFWSSHQRFFKYLCMACKVPHVVELAQKALANKKCVVIGLQSTGEAGTLEQLDEYREIRGEFISTARGVLQNLVEKYFPSTTTTTTVSMPNKTSSPIRSNTESKENKNSQRINDILQRLSAYTNTTQSTTASNKNKLKMKLAKEKAGSRKSYARSSSISSTSSLDSIHTAVTSTSKHSTISDFYNDENDDPMLESDLDNDNSEDYSGEEEEDDGDDSEFDVTSDEVDSGTEFDTNSGVNNPTSEFVAATNKPETLAAKFESKNKKQNKQQQQQQLPVDQSQNDSGISLNLVGADRFDFLEEFGEDMMMSEGFGDFGAGGDESDNDSDELFSITKSVSIQSLVSRNNLQAKKRVMLTSEERRARVANKRKKLKAQEEANEDDELVVSKKKNDPMTTTTYYDFIPKSTPPLSKPTTAHEIGEYAYELKSNLLIAIRRLGKRLPANTLDELIDLLDGPDHVAEMTGRKGRVVCNNRGTNNSTNGSSYVYESRNETDVPLEFMNVMQKERFMNGDKLIAIISEAASSGISLQANRRSANQFRRVHITLELPWSADRAIQQFGRTHRSNQVNAPEYVFLISELAGEKRFASTVAKRLESLGALTHGDRRATEIRDLSRFNIDNKYGRAALDNVIRSICGLEKPLAPLPKSYRGDDFMRDARQALAGVGLIVYPNINNPNQALPDRINFNQINRFLNRLLGCPVNLQNAIFHFFSEVMANVVLEAKRTGKWDMGILDLGGLNEEACRVETKFYTLKNSGASIKRTVEMHTVLVERGLSWAKALEIYEACLNKGQMAVFYLSNHVKNRHRMALLAISNENELTTNNNEKTETTTSSTSITKPLLLSIYKPNTGLQTRLEMSETLLKKYTTSSSLEQAQKHWDAQFTKSSTECTHKFRQGTCPMSSKNNNANLSSSNICELGLRTRRYYILAGAVLAVWSRVEQALATLKGSSQYRLQIIRVKTNDNRKIIGCVIPSQCLRQIDELLISLSTECHVVNTETAAAEAVAAASAEVMTMEEEAVKQSIEDNNNNSNNLLAENSILNSFSSNNEILNYDLFT